MTIVDYFRFKLFVFKYMFDYPTQLLYLKANIEVEPQSNTRKDGKSKKYLHQHSFDTAPSPFVPYSFTIPPQPSITDYPNVSLNNNNIYESNFL